MKIQYIFLSLLLLFGCSSSRKSSKSNYNSSKNSKRLDIYVLVEKSASTDSKATRKYVESALADLVDNVPLDNRSIRISLATFTDKFELRVPITAKRDSLYAGIRAITAMKNNDSTALLDASLDSVQTMIINTWIDQADDDTTTIPAVILVISDGLISDQQTAFVRASVINANEHICIATLISAVGTSAAPGYLAELANQSANYFERDHAKLVRAILNFTQSQ
jgi:hypothetical protein